MSDQKINIAIAEACGWQINKYKYLAKPPNKDWQYKDKIPDYCNDLNAMHEAEKMLNRKQQNDYCFILMDIQNSWGGFKRLHATAKERAEAFLRTIGKWKE